MCLHFVPTIHSKKLLMNKKKAIWITDRRSVQIKTERQEVAESWQRIQSIGFNIELNKIQKGWKVPCFTFGKLLINWIFLFFFCRLFLLFFLSVDAQTGCRTIKYDRTNQRHLRFHERPRGHITSHFLSSVELKTGIRSFEIKLHLSNFEFFCVA